jgi:hypothetical protein
MVRLFGMCCMKYKSIATAVAAVLAEPMLSYLIVFGATLTVSIFGDVGHCSLLHLLDLFYPPLMYISVLPASRVLD